MLRLNINGRDTELDADPHMPPVWLLRDTLGLTGGRVSAIEGLAHDASHPGRRGDADIDPAMAGYICRCGTDQRIRAAIHRAAALRAGA